MSSTSSLRKDALGLPALFFCIATAAAPMTALLFNVPIIVSGAGLLAFSAWLLLDNRGSLAAAEGVPFVDAIPWIVGVVFCVGVVGSLWRDRSGNVVIEGARS